MAALGGGAVIRCFFDGAVGQVPARAHRGGDGFHIAAGFGVDPARQPRHAVGALGAQQQTTPSGTVGLVEIAVGVEDLIDAPPGGLDDVGVVLDRFAHQAGFHIGRGLGPTRTRAAGSSQR